MVQIEYIVNYTVNKLIQFQYFVQMQKMPVNVIANITKIKRNISIK